jgi:hypothetical protein
VPRCESRDARVKNTHVAVPPMTEPNDEIAQAMKLHNEAYGSCTGQPDAKICPIGPCASGICTPP